MLHVAYLGLRTDIADMLLTFFPHVIDLTVAINTNSNNPNNLHAEEVGLWVEGCERAKASHNHPLRILCVRNALAELAGERARLESRLAAVGIDLTLMASHW